MGEIYGVREMEKIKDEERKGKYSPRTFATLSMVESDLFIY